MILYEISFSGRKISLVPINASTMEDRKVDYDCDLSVALKNIQVLLKGEIEYWFKTDNSKTSEKAMIYDEAIELLVQFIHEQDIKSFLIVFAKFNITIA